MLDRQVVNGFEFALKSGPFGLWFTVFVEGRRVGRIPSVWPFRVLAVETSAGTYMVSLSPMRPMWTPRMRIT